MVTFLSFGDEWWGGLKSHARDHWPAGLTKEEWKNGKHYYEFIDAKMNYFFCTYFIIYTCMIINAQAC